MRKSAIAIGILAVLMPALILPAQASALPPGHYREPAMDWPEMLVLKGIAVKGDEVVSAVFIGLEPEDEKLGFSDSYMLVGGEAKRVGIEDVDIRPERGAVVLRLEGGGFLVLKAYQEGYRGTLLVASGSYEGYSLNMRVVGFDDYNAWDVLEAAEEQIPMPVESSVTAEEVAVIRKVGE
jgi:hypothetical protein